VRWTFHRHLARRTATLLLSLFSSPRQKGGAEGRRRFRGSAIRRTGGRRLVIHGAAWRGWYVAGTPNAARLLHISIGLLFIFDRRAPASYRARLRRRACWRAAARLPRVPSAKAALASGERRIANAAAARAAPLAYRSSRSRICSGGAATSRRMRPPRTETLARRGHGGAVVRYERGRCGQTSACLQQRISGRLGMLNLGGWRAF